MKTFRTITLSLLLPLPTVAVAHEFWLEPKKYQVDAGDETGIAFRNGQDFEGIEMSWFDRRIDRADIYADGEPTAYEGLPGDMPAMNATVPEGLVSVAYGSTMSKLTYKTWDLTLLFAEHKDFDWFEEAHAARGLPQEGVTEGYWRFSKTLIAGGDGEGSDVAAGLPTEFVALTNPYADAITEFSARLLYQGEPRPEVQVEVWAKAEDDNVTKSIAYTDAEGVVRFPVTPGTAYQIDSVVLREPASPEAQERDVMWESLWANMTFAVPRR